MNPRSLRSDSHASTAPAHLHPRRIVDPQDIAAQRAAPHHDAHPRFGVLEGRFAVGLNRRLVLDASFDYFAVRIIEGVCRIAKRPFGLHLHHLVWGIVLIMLSGFLGFVINAVSPWNEILAGFFGVAPGTVFSVISWAYRCR